MDLYSYFMLKLQKCLWWTFIRRWNPRLTLPIFYSEIPTRSRYTWVIYAQRIIDTFSSICARTSFTRVFIMQMLALSHENHFVSGTKSIRHADPYSSGCQVLLIFRSRVFANRDIGIRKINSTFVFLDQIAFRRSYRHCTFVLTIEHSAISKISVIKY